MSLLRSLQYNPATASYAFSTERRDGKVALRGRVGTKLAHDAAIQTALSLGVPVVDDLVIDTLAAHQAAGYRGAMAPGMGAGSAGPSSGLGGYPSATTLYGNQPYTYPQPLFGRLDEPFYGFEPPAFSYPPWWGAMSAQRVGLQGGPSGMNGQPGGAIDPNAAPAGGQGETQALELPYGTIDMAINPQGVATLRGTVPSLGERITLGQKVAQTPGVTQVINLLNVKPGIAPAAATSPVADKPPPPPMPSEVVLSPAATASADDLPVIPTETDPVGQRASKAVANRSGLANQSIKVKVRDGVATVTGKVPTVYEAMLAYRAVQRTPGVREIEDKLEFLVPDGESTNPLIEKGRPEDVEPYLEAQIRRQLGDLAHLDRIRVQGKSLDIRGTLEREDDRPRFDAIIRSIPILRGFRVTAEVPAESR